MQDKLTYKNPKGQKQKTLINRCLVLYIHSLPFFTLTGSSEEDIPVALHVGQQTKVLPIIIQQAGNENIQTYQVEVVISILLQILITNLQGNM